MQRDRRGKIGRQQSGSALDFCGGRGRGGSLACGDAEKIERVVQRVLSGSARVSRVGLGVSPKQSYEKIREGETPSPTRETRALPGVVMRS